MAAQGERVSGAIDIDAMLSESMVQDEEAEQEMLVVEEQEQSPPQMDLEPEMGAAAACDTSPPLLHQNPSPIPAESAQPSTFDMGRLLARIGGFWWRGGGEVSYAAAAPISGSGSICGGDCSCSSTTNISCSASSSCAMDSKLLHPYLSPPTPAHLEPPSCVS